MARTARNAKLDSRTARLKLDRHKWHHATLEPGLALRYRRTAQGFGVWFARIEGRSTDTRIGLADDYAVDDFAFRPENVGGLVTTGSMFLGSVYRPYTATAAALRLMGTW